MAENAGLLRRTWKQLADERFIRHNSVVTGASVAGGILGVALHSLVSHRLTPADYAAVFAMITFQGLALPATGWTAAVVAQTTSRSLADGRPGVSAAVLRVGNRGLLGVGVGLAMLMVATAPAIAGSLRIEARLVYAAAAGLPFLLAVSVLFGALQGLQRFGTIAVIYLLQASLRLAGGVGGGAALGAFGAVAGFSAAAALTYAVMFIALRPAFHHRRESPDWSRLLRYCAVIAPAGLVSAVLLTTDVEAVKHFFSASAAGEYAVVAVLGRAIFWGAVSITTVLFPKVAFRDARGQGVVPLVVTAVVFMLMGGGFALVVFMLLGRQVIALFAGQAYIGAASYLGLYAVGMCLFGGASVLMAVHQSRGRPHFLWILVAVTLAEPLLIIAFHATLTEVVWIVDGCMAALFAGVAAAFVFDERRGGPRPPASSTAPEAPWSRRR